MASEYKYVAVRMTGPNDQLQKGPSVAIYAHGPTREKAIERLDRSHPHTTGKPTDIFAFEAVYQVQVRAVKVG